MKRPTIPIRVESDASDSQATHLVEMLFYYLRVAGMTNAEFAAQAGISIHTLESWRKKKLPTLVQITKGFAALGLVLTPQRTAISLDSVNPKFEICDPNHIRMLQERDRQSGKGEHAPRPGSPEWELEEGKFFDDCPMPTREELAEEQRMLPERSAQSQRKQAEKIDNRLREQAQQEAINLRRADLGPVANVSSKTNAANCRKIFPHAKPLPYKR